VRVTRPLQRLLSVLVTDPSAHWYGYELMKSAALSSGTLYPMLARLEEQGLVTSQWEPAPVAGGRPPRRYYELTGEGARVARKVTQQGRTAVRSTVPRLAGSS
jgi:PadR family transcriptional regulator, regulatory protein PadR